MNSRVHLRGSKIRRVAFFVIVSAFMTACASTVPAPDLSGTELSRCRTASPVAGAADRQPLTITFFGVSTLLFDDSRDRILVDGFFSRPRVAETLFLGIRSNSERISAGLGEGPPRVRALLVAHAHHDHALDVVAVATREKNALVVGTPATLALAAANNIALARLCLGSDRERFDLGSFTIRALDSPHGPSIPLVGSLIDRPMVSAPRGDAHFTQFADDNNLSFLITHNDRTRILVHPSAGTIDFSAFSADVVFLGMGRVGTMTPDAAQDYFSNVLGGGGSLIVPIHWDAFTTPPDDPLRASPWPLDDVRRGIDYLCAFVESQVGLTVMKPDMRSTLVIEPDGALRTQGKWTSLCKPN